MSEPVAPAASPSLVLVTGMSGAGKSIALKALEDFDYYCIDNLPADLLDPGVRSLMRDGDRMPARVAVSIDVRNRDDLARMPERLAVLRQRELDPKLLFIDAGDETLLLRYAETRRRHPLSRHGLALADAIASEREALAPLRSSADIVIDTTALNVHQLRRRISEALGLHGAKAPTLLFRSFAYRRGLPPDADFVFDARMLPNPHWRHELRPLSGRDAPVRNYLAEQPEVQHYLSQVSGFLDSWLPSLREDTRSYVTVAFGCTGGRHRSVFLAEAMASHARDHGWPDAVTHHRELD